MSASLAREWPVDKRGRRQQNCCRNQARLQSQGKPEWRPRGWRAIERSGDSEVVWLAGIGRTRSRASRRSSARSLCLPKTTEIFFPALSPLIGLLTPPRGGGLLPHSHIEPHEAGALTVLSCFPFAAVSAAEAQRFQEGTARRHPPPLPFHPSTPSVVKLGAPRPCQCVLVLVFYCQFHSPPGGRWNDQDPGLSAAAAPDQVISRP